MTFKKIVSEKTGAVGSTGLEVEQAFNDNVDYITQNYLGKQQGSNLLDPSKFRYGYFYYSNANGILNYNANMNYGCTDYIPAKAAGLVTTGTGQVTDGLSSYAVFNANKVWLRNGQNTDRYTYQPGDGFVVFIYYINGNLNFAASKAVVEGTAYSFESYTDYQPLTQLSERMSTLEKAGVNMESCKNGNPITYGNVSNFAGAAIIDRNVVSDYLVLRVIGTGNSWVLTPLFTPKGPNLVHIKFSVEFTKVGTTTGLRVFVADQISVTGHYTIIKDNIVSDGEYDITFDPAYYTVYGGYTQFYVWIANQSMGDNTDEITAKLSALEVVEYDNSVSAVNISGDNVKELFESTDQQITNLKSQLTDKEELISSLGNKFEIGVTDNGNIVAIPIIPTTGAFFGNSLISGFGYGMAASESTKDYYYLITEYIKTLVPGFIAPRIGASGFEGIIDPANIDSVIQSTFVANLTGNENIVSIQLGDNVNTPEKNAVFPESSLRLCKAIRAKCPNARVVWMGMWYGSAEKYTAIQNACSQTGCKFITFADLISPATRNVIGNLTKTGNTTRTLNDVTNVVANTATNITVTFTVGGISYNSTIEVSSYNLNSGVLTYTSEYMIIDSAGVASHPSDPGHRLIANRFLYEMKLTTDNQYYID